MSDLTDALEGASIDTLDGAGGGTKPKKKKSSKKVRGASDVTRARDEGYYMAIQNMERCAPHFRVPPALIREAFEMMRMRVEFLESCFAKHDLKVPSHLSNEVEDVQTRLLTALARVEVFERHITTDADKSMEGMEVSKGWSQAETEAMDRESNRQLQLLEMEEAEEQQAEELL